MVRVQPGVKVAHEVLDLIDGDRVADARIDATALLKGAAAVDANDLAVHVEERPAAVAGIDRGIDLDAIRVFEQDAGGVLIPVDAADQAVGHGGREVGRQEKRVTHGERPVAGFHLVAVAHWREREFLVWLLWQQLDEGHVADLVQADEHGIVEHAIGQAALHDRAGALHHVEVGDGEAVLADQHAGTAALAARREDGDDRRLDLFNDGDPFRLGVEDGLVHALGLYRHNDQCGQRDKSRERQGK